MCRSLTTWKEADDDRFPQFSNRFDGRHKVGIGGNHEGGIIPIFVGIAQHVCGDADIGDFLLEIHPLMPTLTASMRLVLAVPAQIDMNQVFGGERIKIHTLPIVAADKPIGTDIRNKLRHLSWCREILHSEAGL